MVFYHLAGQNEEDHEKCGERIAYLEAAARELAGAGKLVRVRKTLCSALPVANGYLCCCCRTVVMTRTAAMRCSLLVISSNKSRLDLGEFVDLY